MVPTLPLTQLRRLPLGSRGIAVQLMIFSVPSLGLGSILGLYLIGEENDNNTSSAQLG